MRFGVDFFGLRISLAVLSIRMLLLLECLDRLSCEPRWGLSWFLEQGRAEQATTQHAAFALVVFGKTHK